MIAVNIIKINHVQVFQSKFQKNDPNLRFCVLMCTGPDDEKIMIKGTIQHYMVSLKFN